MVREVQIIKCDSCDFEKEIGLINYPQPEGWLHVQGCGDLCPTCAHRFRSYVTDLFDGNVPDEWRPNYV